MSGFRDHVAYSDSGLGFSSRMRNFLDEKIRIGRDGIDMNMDKKGARPFLIHRNFEMSDDVFNLACDIEKDSPSFNYKAWVHYMVNTRLRISVERVIVYTRNRFQCEYAQRYLGQTMQDYFQLPVFFEIDHSLESACVR